jgi:hypothetical protein
MPARYSFEVDSARDLVRIVMAGLFMPVHVDDFFEARRRAHEALTCAPGRHVTLTDISALETLPQETADAFAALLMHPQSRARRLAFVVSPRLLQRGQLWRVLAGREARSFTDPVAAEAWLTEGIAAHPVPRRTGGGIVPRPAAPTHEAPDATKSLQIGFFLDSVALIW